MIIPRGRYEATSTMLPMLNEGATLVDRLRAADRALLDTLYDSACPMITAHVRRNGGTADDARDLFQEALILLMQQAQRPGFVLTAAPSTYLFAVARYQWSKRRRERARQVDVHAVPLAHEDPAFELNDAERPGADVLLGRITAHCRRILQAIYLASEPMAALMARMGWKNRHTADNQKYKCLQQARKVALR